MQKVLTKTIGIFSLALLVMSIVGAATTCTPCTANPDTFNFNSLNHCGNVLSNDIGTSNKVVSVSKTTNGGKVSMSRNGDFCYKQVSSSNATVSDSFIYTIKNKCGQKSTAKVTINYMTPTCTPCTANPDTFNFNSTKHCGNVLSNDNGTGIKVVSISKTTIASKWRRWGR